MADLFWLTEQQVGRMSPHFPRSRGIARVDDLRVLSGILHVIRNGLRWRDAPADYGLPGTLKSARYHASNRQVITLETGTPSRSKSAPDHAAIRHVFRRLLGAHLSEVSAVQ